MPLNEKEYFVVPAFIFVPAGISAFSVIEESWPGTTGSGSREPPVNLKTDVPFEQSVTVLEAFRIAIVAASAVKRVIITYDGGSLDGVCFFFSYYLDVVSWPIFLEQEEAVLL
jgi:hypothetical protein